MNEKTKSACRIYAIQAREARLAVVFRRGPSKQVLLLLWNTETDTFIEGQWFKGRIYERRCDLSPNGKHLIYFASSQKPPYVTWTAVSKPPYLTAIALWPKGDCWGGGGLFKKEQEIQLNHKSHEMNLTDKFTLPKFVKVCSLGEYSGRGEDSPILDYRLSRDGWTLTQEGKSHWTNYKGPVHFRYDPYQIYDKPNPKKQIPHTLREMTMGVGEEQGSSYVIEYQLINNDSGNKMTIGRADWADWCHSGDLLYAKDGRIYRLGFEKKKLKPIEESKQLIDLRDKVFTEKAPPEVARRWGDK